MAVRDFRQRRSNDRKAAQRITPPEAQREFAPAYREGRIASNSKYRPQGIKDNQFLCTARVWRRRRARRFAEQDFGEITYRQVDRLALRPRNRLQQHRRVAQNVPLSLVKLARSNSAI